MKRLVAALICMLVLSSCTAVRTGGGSGAGTPDIRVLMEEGAASLTLATTGGFTIKSAGGLELLDSRTPDAISVSASGRTLNVTLQGGNTAAADDGVIIEPHSRSAIVYKDVQYDGVMRVRFGADRMLMLLNVLPLETYLAGVVPYEIGNPGADAYDAVKTQAVAARTYAYGKMQTRKKELFDVYASIQDQVYGGRARQNRTTTSAVRDTRGRVLNYKGQVVKAYYSACCGGHTSDIRLMWPDREPADYLHGIRDRDRSRMTSFCSEYRYFRWRYSYSGRELGDMLRITLPRELGVSAEDVGAVKNMRIARRSDSGRVVALEIETTEGTFDVDGDRVRWVLMSDVARGRILPSAMFRLDKVMERDRIAFVSIAGGGNGHGVGMCQNGAIGMAKQGYTYEMILAHYFPGAVVDKVY